MKVRPLPFQTVAEFVPSYSVDDVFRGYAVLGGIPYFWQGVNPQRSMTENLAANILRSNGFLNDEAQSALRQEFRDPATYNAILQTIAFGSTSRNEIAQKSLVDTRTLSKYLSVLEDMDLVVKEFPVFTGPGELGNASRGRYRIADPYVKFWFRFVANNPTLIMTRQEALSEWKATVEPCFADFAAESFEQVCRQYRGSLLGYPSTPQTASDAGFRTSLPPPVRARSFEVENSERDRTNPNVLKCSLHLIFSNTLRTNDEQTISFGTGMARRFAHSMPGLS